VRVAARCHGDAGSVRERAVEVLRAILAHGGPPWPAVAEWRKLLPGWFVENSAPERSRAEAERWLVRWRSLSAEEQAKATSVQSWTLADWLYWLEPAERQWFWWDSVIESPDELHVMVDVPGWPAPLGALDWLLRAAGAVQITHVCLKLLVENGRWCAANRA
jgi:hypothetical protein